jgi:cytochrome P450
VTSRPADADAGAGGDARAGASVTLAELDADPHPVLARLRERAHVCWVPALGGWLVIGYDVAVAVLKDAATFTVDDPRFTTARVTGPGMLSLDGPEHARHRGPFARAFGQPAILARLEEFTAAEAGRLADALAQSGRGGTGSSGGAAELRTAFAGPLAAAVMTEALGLGAAGATPGTVLSWYRDIVAAVAALPADEPGTPADRVPVASFAALDAAVRETTRRAAREQSRAGTGSGHATLLSEAAAAGGLTDSELVADAAVVLFGGIETTEGMICNAVLGLFREHGLQEHGLVRAAERGPVPAIVEESLRLEPAAARVDRYATRDVTLAGASIRRGDPVIVSLTGANRDPAVFGHPDRFDPARFDPARADLRRHLAFAHGPHFCLGAKLARMETVAPVTTQLERFPGFRPAGGGPARVRGLVFRKPTALHVAWD